MPADVFLIIDDIDVNNNRLDGYTYTNGIHAIMRRFEKTLKRIKNTNCTFVKRGKRLDKLTFLETGIILSDIAVVPDFDRNKRAGSDWLVVSNRRSWLESFEKSNCKLRRVTNQNLIRQCTLLTSEDSSSDDGQEISQDSSDDGTS